MGTIRIKTSELAGVALDWAVTKCLIENPIAEFDYFFIKNHGNGHGHYSTDWQQGGPIIGREKIDVAYAPENEGEDWVAHAVWSDEGDYFGPTPLIAAMRCYVARKLGDEVEIPEELL